MSGGSLSTGMRGLTLTNHPSEPQRRHGARVALRTPRQLAGGGWGGLIGKRRPLPMPLPLLLLSLLLLYLLLPPLLLLRRRRLLRLLLRPLLRVPRSAVRVESLVSEARRRGGGGAQQLGERGRYAAVASEGGRSTQPQRKPNAHFLCGRCRCRCRC